MESTAIVSLGNAGFRVARGGRSVLIDPLLGESGEAAAGEVGRPQAILITHDHWDHFSAAGVSALARRAGAVVVGPRPVVSELKSRLPAGLLAELEPPAPAGKAKCAGVGAVAAGVAVTAYRTAHGRCHNSYLVELGGFRLFHDGDNENTRILDPAPLAGIEALMLCPWQGSGWVEFIEAVRPRHWFLQHMTDEELDDHERGEFFPGLCDRLPMQPVALRSGGEWTGGKDGEAG